MYLKQLRNCLVNYGTKELYENISVKIEICVAYDRCSD